MSDISITPVPVRRSVRVEAPPARAFDVFTRGMAQWWLPSHKIGATPFKDVVVEPRAGGRWFERGEDGAECNWGKVLVWEPPARLVLAWQINGQWQFDPALVTEVEVRFVGDAGGTLVELEHRYLERYGDQAGAVRARFESPAGWAGLLDAFAKAA